MPRKKKEDLLTQSKELTETSSIIAIDESGNYLSEEEARLEEERLEKEMSLFFQSNPYQPSTYEIEEDKNQESIVSLNAQGDVLAEKEIQTMDKEVELLVHGTTVPSYLESLFLEQIIQKRLAEIAKANEEIEKVSEHFYRLENGHSLYDNFVDSYRKERGRLSSYLFLGEDLSIESIKEKETKRILKNEMKLAIKDMFALKDVFQEDLK